MKKYLAFFLLIPVILFAQFDLGISFAFPREINNPCNSAAVASGQTYFNADFMDTLNDPSSTTIFPVNDANVYCSTNGGTSWLSPISMSNIGGTNYEDTWQASRTNAGSGTVEYFYQCETESTYSSECPDNVPTSFPLAANRSIYISDPAGDHTDVDAGRRWDSYDITGFYASYDNDEFFFRVTLAGGWTDIHSSWWPLYTYYHILAIPILNNESPYRDSLFFAVVIANANFLIVNVNDGLYKFWGEDDDEDPLNNYDEICNLTYSSGPDGSSDITVRIPISQLTSNGWGTWPNETEVFGTSVATGAAWLVGLDSVAYQLTDFINATGVYCHTHQYTIGTNTGPSLSQSASQSSNRDTTVINLECTYTDANNNLPTTRQIRIDDGTLNTYDVGTPDHVYDDGADFTYDLTYRCEYVDTIKYNWIFSDGQSTDSTGWMYQYIPEDIQLQIDPGSWTIAPDLEALDTVVMIGGDEFTITNTGNVQVDFGLLATVLPIGWHLSTYTDWDTTVVYGRFDDSATPPDITGFDADDALDDAAIIWCDGTHFGGGGQNVSFCVDGANSENLWMGFIVPEYYGGPGDQTITVQLWARADLP